jgi:hypothetical protein
LDFKSVLGVGREDKSGASELKRAEDWQQGSLTDVDWLLMSTFIKNHRRVRTETRIFKAA